jgi:Reverse transcriptase (RNA-dependent DNA polymerase)
VDDIVVTGNNPVAIASLKTIIHNTFSIKDLGDLHYFLEIEVHPHSNGLHLSQTRYLTSLLDKASMLTAKPCSTPLQAGVQLSKMAGIPLEDPTQYRAILGALQYATFTRPDLTYSVNKVSQFFAQPTDVHWQALKRILRYVKGTLNMGLNLQPGSNLTLNAYCDADWVGCPDDRRSTTGYAVFLGPNLVSWSSKKQGIVSRSSTEAEYQSMTVTTAELMWLQSLLHDLGHTIPSPPALWCDNLDATFLAANLVFHARTKHIELDFHFVREQLAVKKISVHFICSADQMGDLFTKSLAKSRYQLLRIKINVVDNPLSLRGV